MTARPPLPPFDQTSARRKVQALEDARNTRESERVAVALSPRCLWREQDEWMIGRVEILDFLTRKYKQEVDYALRLELWSFRGSRIAVRSQSEWNDIEGRTRRGYANEIWDFDDHGLLARYETSLAEREIHARERRIHGSRPEAEYGNALPVR